MERLLPSVSLHSLLGWVEGSKGLGAPNQGEGRGIPRRAKGPAPLSCAGIALFQPRRFCRAGVGPAAISLGTAAASKSRRVPLACAIQLLAGGLILLMDSGSLFIILLISMFCSVSLKGRSLFKWRSTFFHEQKKRGDRIAGTWQDIDRGWGNWHGWLIGSYFGERGALGVCVALGINIQQFRSPVRNIYSQANSFSAVPSSAMLSRWIHNKSAVQHFPHHICLLEGSSWTKKERKRSIFCWYLNPPLFPRPPPLPLSCLLPEGEKNISTQRQHCNLFFAISHGAQIEIELDRDIRSARCDNCKRILFKNTLTFVHPVSNI